MRISHVVAFALGAGVGGASAYYFLKKKFAKIAQEEIDSVKESYRVPKPFDEIPAEETSTDDKKEKAEMAREKKSINEYAKLIHENGYHQKYSDAKTEEDKEDAPDFEYISPDELGEIDTYTVVDLTYYADGVLADDGDEVVEDFMERVGNFTTHFGEYEDDVVYVRNDARKLYYEIIRDHRFYADVIGIDLNDEEE